MNIGGWLQSLGLERYLQAFDENDIDAEVLASLTADDLIGLGVTSVGHRRKLLDAIAALRSNIGPALRPPIAPVGGSPLPNPPLPGLDPGITGEGRVVVEAERRQLTVMFCDLVGLDGALVASRSRGSARGHRRVSSRCRPDRRRVRRLCRQIHGRRCPGLFRLPSGA